MSITKKISASGIKTIQTISSKTKDEVIKKMCDHIIESNNDLENAMNVLIQDAAFYKPLFSADLGEIFVTISKEVNQKIQYKNPKR